MSVIELWYDKAIEVDPRASWLANSQYLISATIRKSYEDCPYQKVLPLIEYSRPDFILTVDKKPILVCESTKEIPTGNNIPQRFPCILRAAELGVPSIFYFLKSARKNTTVAQKNPSLNINVRVLLAQLRLSEIYDVPSMTLFVPTNPLTQLPTTRVADHAPLAKMVEKILKSYENSKTILSSTDTLVTENKMLQKNTITSILNSTNAKGYIVNNSYRAVYPNGSAFISKYVTNPKYCIDPTKSCNIVDTDLLLQNLHAKFGKKYYKTSTKNKLLLSREHTFVYKGTANSSKSGPEHPFPGVLTMFDILYVRKDKGVSIRDREMNIAFELPITFQSYKDNVINKPTGLNILNNFCDMIILIDAVVIAGWMLNLHAGAVLLQ